MSNRTFRHVIGSTLGQEEYDKGLTACKASSRSQLIAAELTQLVTEDRRVEVQRKRWPFAPHMNFAKLFQIR